MPLCGPRRAPARLRQYSRGGSDRAPLVGCNRLDGAPPSSRGSPPASCRAHCCMYKCTRRRPPPTWPQPTALRRDCRLLQATLLHRPPSSSGHLQSASRPSSHIAERIVQRVDCRCGIIAVLTALAALASSCIVLVGTLLLPPAATTLATAPRHCSLSLLALASCSRDLLVLGIEVRDRLLQRCKISQPHLLDRRPLDLFQLCSLLLCHTLELLLALLGERGNLHDEEVFEPCPRRLLVAEFLEFELCEIFDDVHLLAVVDVQFLGDDHVDEPGPVVQQVSFQSQLVDKILLSQVVVLQTHFGKLFHDLNCVLILLNLPLTVEEHHVRLVNC
mmetsp:Transcript_100211/g.251256  ORF Transcript_100211/g.251256 Transcript_100211/m.251256 type:complete len:332 (-) Transcript_100211:641-1636(-)